MLSQTYRSEFYTLDEQVLLALLREHFAVDSCREKHGTNEIVSKNNRFAIHDFDVEETYLIRLADEFNTSPTVISLAVFGILIHRYMLGSQSVNICIGMRQLTIPIRDCKLSTIIASIRLYDEHVSKFMSFTLNMAPSSTIVGQPIILSVDTKPNDSTKVTRDCHLVYFKDSLDDTIVHGMSKAFKYLLEYFGNFGRSFDLSYSELISIPLVHSSRTIDGLANMIVANSSSHTIYATFQAIAHRYSDRICLQQSGSDSLVYSQCLALVDQLACLLQYQLGVTKSSVVGLWMSNSFEYVIALLAILKVGAVFVPLDIKHPNERVEYIEKEACINVVLTNKSNTSSTENDPIFQSPKIQMHIINDGKLQIDNICINSDFSKVQYESENQGGYIIFTSGSSGKPKGVQIQESGLLNMVFSQICTFDIKPSDTVAQYASICFDASLSEIMMALLAGASLAIFRSSNERTGSEFIDTLNLFSVSVITLPPSLLSAIDPEKLPCMRIIISAGELCSRILACKWSNSYRRFFNAYGPSEAAVCRGLSKTTYQHYSSAV